jgi:iron complex transport system substrate-binding protein
MKPGRAVANVLGAMLVQTAMAVHADIRVVDDSGAAVILQSPAKRIVSLAPHATELLFAAGAGERIVGTTEFSDYPEAAKKIPRVGSSSLLDMDRVVSLKPDLIVVWWHGSSQNQQDKLRTLGVPIFQSELRKLDDIPRALLELGTLAGTEDDARRAARAFTARREALRARYSNASPVTLFWQVWARPLLTINGRHLISDVIRLCGGVNVFDRLSPLVPAVNMEAVVAENPEAIVTTRTDASVNQEEGLADWRALTHLRATRNHNLIVLDADTIHRQSPRVLDGAEALCERLQDVRARRPR